jgi:hypothetical protein
MPAQDIGPTWRDWADATFCADFATKSRVISRTDSQALRQLADMQVRLDHLRVRPRQLG